MQDPEDKMVDVKNITIQYELNNQLSYIGSYFHEVYQSYNNLWDIGLRVSGVIGLCIACAVPNLYCNKLHNNAVVILRITDITM